ncbi:hypothetical protein GMRT_20365 [Giardia muris]|uniref:Cyclin N-terminal domain-containing protein n=1 Tax=Giardia muris TaxID=5742 RepID=A0A4Z1SUJ7_GIAMU|nr:hypothetical protein GMRT_23002 [Giardia muris]TNJ29572.1 hypothetical protein GMRT_20365 [Giardia muris]|eukprot:TNJ27422.1 hypothetical protein GMRT_23002 [Giardia muris]
MQNLITTIHIILTELFQIQTSERRFRRRFKRICLITSCVDMECIVAILYLARAMQGGMSVTSKTLHNAFFIALSIAVSLMRDSPPSLQVWANCFWTRVDSSKVFGAQLMFLNYVDWSLYVNRDDIIEVERCIDLINSTCIHGNEVSSASDPE